MSARRILVVDDDPDLSDLLLIALSSRGYEARAASDGLQALATLEHWRPDLITLDLEMPGLDGWGFVVELRRGPHASVPVLLLTGVWQPERYGEALGVPTMRKPFRLDELLATIARLTGQETGLTGTRPGTPPAGHHR